MKAGASGGRTASTASRMSPKFQDISQPRVIDVYGSNVALREPQINRLRMKHAKSRRRFRHRLSGKLTLLTLLPVVRRFVEVVSARPEIAVVLGHVFKARSRRLFEHVLRHRDDIAAFVGVVVEHRPGNRMVFLAHAENAAETEDGEHDVVGHFVENDILDMADLVAGGVVNRGSLHFRGKDGAGVSAWCGHEVHSRLITECELPTPEIVPIIQARSSIFSSVRSSSASRDGLSQRNRLIRGNRMATPDLCRVERCNPSKATSMTRPKSLSARTERTGPKRSTVLSRTNLSICRSSSSVKPK